MNPDPNIQLAELKAILLPIMVENKGEITISGEALTNRIAIDGHELPVTIGAETYTATHYDWRYKSADNVAYLARALARIYTVSDSAYSTLFNNLSKVISFCIPEETFTVKINMFMLVHLTETCTNALYILAAKILIKKDLFVSCLLDITLHVGATGTKKIDFDSTSLEGKEFAKLTDSEVQGFFDYLKRTTKRPVDISDPRGEKEELVISNLPSKFKVCYPSDEKNLDVLWYRGYKLSPYEKAFLDSLNLLKSNYLEAIKAIIRLNKENTTTAGVEK